MKRVFSFLLCLGVAAGIFVAAPVAHADVNNFTVTSFTADETLTSADPQGELHIVEHINVDFTDMNHGILRALPNTYKKHRLLLHVNQVSSRSGAPAMYSTSNQNGNMVVKIGDPARTVTGSQEYTIDYTVKNVITFYNDHDELFWDVNGDQWTQDFNKVSLNLHLPNGLKLDSHLKPICYTGTFGSTEHACVISTNKTASSDTITASTTRPLEGFQTLSYVAGFEKGYFHPYSLADTLGEYGADIAVFTLPLLLLGGTAGLYWFRHGRDPRGRGVIVPEYGAPKGLGPIEVGTLIDFRTDNKDITAAIIDLAIRRYITIIEETQERKLRRDVTTYSLRLENPGMGELNEFERTIMDALFVGAGPGETVDLAEKKFSLATTASVLRTTVKKSLITRGYFRPSAFTLRTFGLIVLCIIGVCIVGGVAAHFAAGLAYGLGTAAGGILAVIFFGFSASRTELGVTAKEQVLGLKMYLDVAEKDRINKLQSPGGRYAASMKEPKRTVQLFEKLLPYAMILGVEKQWAKQFENIYRTAPDWYSGNWNTFSVVYLVSSLNSGVGQQVNTAFASPSSSSGSGFGGGGAGGGGGGGGGGGW
ncbi:MAG TPA: DUF2207 domain-containing protein [Candidatus Saccharimonadales bacterium]|nr:DUF2207 domain-containing protein [Candidatus Saccharimonadales bacterium]